MADTWSAEELTQIAAADELEIAVRQADGALRRWTPIWVVAVDEQVFVRTWYRRDGGWFGHVVDSRQARIRVPGVETDVVVEDVGVGPAGLRASIDAAYRTTYERYGHSSVEPMVTDAAAAATLQLWPS